MELAFDLNGTASMAIGHFDEVVAREHYIFSIKLTSTS
jgi:hypothetical protein